MVIINEVLTFKAVAKATSLSRSSIYRAISNGSFPVPINLSAKRKAFLANEIDHWLGSRIHESRSNPRLVIRG